MDPPPKSSLAQNVSMPFTKRDILDVPNRHVPQNQVFE